MAITKQRKEELVAQYSELLDQSKAIILTEYSGLNVKQMQALRAQVRQADGAYYVTKNTLLRLALSQSGHELPEELLVGQLATGFAMNEVPTLAKALTEFAKDQEELTIVGGLLDDELLTAEQVKALAELPSLDELRAQIMGMLQAPARNLATVVSGGVRQVVNVLDAYAKQDEAEASA
ncbi:MAG TPA: 50S ribosomal protein L10 [Anaerolineae bacterium]|nr:50S ribosomal protein L10 [Anaerolineae bacterium]